MKNLFVVFVFIFLSCKDKKAQNNIETATISTAENAREIENYGLETTSEKININQENNPNQDYIKSTLFKGTLNGNIKITMYLKEQENACGGDLTFFIGMYKYDDQNKWILLDVTTDRQKKNFCMVEDGFSGVLFLEDNKGDFTGNWISTDTKKQFKVELEDQLLDIKFAKYHTAIEKLDDILFDDLIYNKNDC